MRGAGDGQSTTRIEQLVQSATQRHIGRARRWARRLAMQAIYQWQMTGQGVNEIDGQFQNEEDLSKADSEYFHALLHGVIAHVEALDSTLAQYAKRSMDQVDPVERAILRCACYELAHRLDVPYKVIINEAVELAKKFGAEQGHKFVNGVLDKVAPRLR
jgi:transcription antitermination protein NusB